MSITLTNIYLTYKREITVRTKSMLMAVTDGVQSDPGSSQRKGGRMEGCGGSGEQSGWALIGTSLQAKDLRANAHTATLRSWAPCC